MQIPISLIQVWAKDKFVFVDKDDPFNATYCLEFSGRLFHLFPDLILQSRIDKKNMLIINQGIWRVKNV